MTEEPQAGQKPGQGGFDIHNGMTVEVLTLENRLTFVGKVESYQNGAIVVRDAKGNDLPRVLYNKEIKLRFAHGQETLVLHGKICGSTDQIWKVDRLESKFQKEQRAFFRQRIRPNTEAVCSRRARQGCPGSKPMPCIVVDVSAGGVLITSEEAYEVGDRLTIAGAYLTTSMDPFNFNCLVCRVGGRSDGKMRYGCKFESLPPKEQDRLLRAIFTVQREEIRSQKERDGF